MIFICIKPGVQFNLHGKYYWGIETGIGLVIFNWDSKTGFGFAEEYDDCTQLGSCSEIYIGKYFEIGSLKKKLGLSTYWFNFFAEKHAENFAGLRLNYFFCKL